MRKFSVNVFIEVWGEDEDEVFHRIYRGLETKYGGGNVYVEDIEDLEVKEHPDEVQFETENMLWDEGSV